MRSTHRSIIAFGLFLLGSLFAILLVGWVGPSVARAEAPVAPVVTPTCGPIWLADTTPNVGTTDNALAGVAVISSTDVWAVGFYTDTNGVGNTLIEHYNGSAWSIVSGPNPGTGGSYLEAVTAISATDIWAVGFYRQTTGSAPQTLTIHYNGTSWTQATSASPGAAENYLYGVAMVSLPQWLGRGLHSRHNQHLQDPDPALGRPSVDPDRQPHALPERGGPAGRGSGVIE